MAQFKIHTVRVLEDGTTAEGEALRYDNMTSELLFDSTQAPVFGPSPDREWVSAIPVAANIPGKKKLPKVLKISLGLSCNYSCEYCSQRFVPHDTSASPDQAAGLMTKLDTLGANPDRIEFWGGEPLVYWKMLVPLAEALRAKFPKAAFGMVTNGSLLDAEKNQWLENMGFSIGLSHDGPGYHVRGLDPMDNPEQREGILDLYNRLHPKGRMSVNAMLHKNNVSRADIQEWLSKNFSEDVRIGEGGFIDPYDQGGLANTFDVEQEHAHFRQKAFREIRTGSASNFDVVHTKITGFIESLAFRRPASAVGQKCGMDRQDNIAIDMSGNVLTCQNVSAISTAPNGQAHKIGHIDDLENVAMKSSTHWSERAHCSGCPVLQLCAGSCMFLEGDLWKAGCDSSYSDNIPFFAAAIESATGLLPVYIEGDLPENRKVVWGSTVTEAPAKSKVILMKQV